MTARNTQAPTSERASNWARIESLVESIPSNVALPLSNKSHPPLHERTLERDWENAPEGFTLKAHAKASIAILNQPGKDVDVLKLWGRPQEEAPAALLAADDAKPYLCYGLESSGQLEVKTKQGRMLPLSIDAGADLELGFFAYRQHNSSKQLGQALLADLPKLRTLLRPDSIRSLEAGNALAMKWKGAIGLKAKVDWSTLLGAIVSNLSALNLTGGLVDIAIGASIVTDFEFSLEDNYLLVFAKNEKTNRLLVEVRKDHHSAVGANLGFRVATKSSLSPKGSKTLQLLKGQIGAQLMGISAEAFGKLEASLSELESLAPELRETVDRLSQRFLGKPLDSLVADEKSKLTHKLSSWMEQLENSIVRIAKQQFEQSLHWSYRSVRANEALVRVEIPAAFLASKKFDALHNELRIGKLTRLQALAKTQDDGADNYYLTRVSREQVTQFNLGISFGDFVFGKSTRTTRGFAWTENRKGELLPSFLLNTDRSVHRGREAETLYAGATAVGIDYQAEDELRISNLNLDLTLNQTNNDERIKPDEFIEYLDTARIWGAFPQDLDSLNAAVALLTKKHEQGKVLKFHSKIQLTNEGMEKLLGTQAADDAELWGEALALSMQTFLIDERLSDLELRKAAYADAARLAFETDDITSSVLSDIKAALLEDLENEGLSELADYEQSALKANRGRQGSRQVRIGNRRSSLTTLREQLLIPLCLKRRDLFASLLSLQEFARLLHVDTDDYQDRKEFEDEVRKRFDVLKYVRRNKALFRSIGAYAALKSLAFPAEARARLLSATFQVTEESPNSGESQIISFAG